MQGATEYILSTQPFVIRRRARWSECDPAGVVYTGRFVDYLLSAVALFNEHLSGETMESAKQKLQIQTPCKGLSLVFDGALWPNNEFDMHVSITAIRSSSFDISVRAVRPTGEAVFSGVVSPICIGMTERRSVPIPEELRQRLEAAMSASKSSLN